MLVANVALWNRVTLGTTSSNTSPVRLENMEGASVQLTVHSGDIVGTVKVQGSNDYGGPNTANNAADPYSPSTASPTISNWTDISGGSMSLSGTTGSPFLVNMAALYFRWFRLSYTYTSGTSSVVSAIVFAKGPKL